MWSTFLLRDCARERRESHLHVHDDNFDDYNYLASQQRQRVVGIFRKRQTPHQRASTVSVLYLLYCSFARSLETSIINSINRKQVREDSRAEVFRGAGIDVIGIGMNNFFLDAIAFVCLGCHHRIIALTNANNGRCADGCCLYVYFGRCLIREKKMFSIGLVRGGGSMSDCDDVVDDGCFPSDRTGEGIFYG